jgi:hypothetical protein
MNRAGIQGQLGKIVIIGIIVSIIAIILYYLVIGFLSPPVEAFSVRYTLNNANQYTGKNITVQGYYENGIITDIPANTSTQINNWNPSMVYLPVNTTHVPVALYANKSYYFTGTLETIKDTRVYPLSTVLLNVTTVKPV